MKFVAIFVLLFVSGINTESIELLNDVDEISSANVILDIIERFRDVLNNAVVSLLESQRDNIANGFPPYIPPLDPLFIEEYVIESTEVVGFSSFQMTLTDSYLKGLKDYKVTNVDIRPLRLSARITFSFDRIEMEGFHTTQARVIQQPIPINLNGNGPFNMTLNNLDVTIYADFSIKDGAYLNVRNLVVAYTIGSATTNFSGFGLLTNLFNNLAGVAIPAVLMIQQVELNLMIYEQLIPSLNYLLNQFTILDLIVLFLQLLKTAAINRIMERIIDIIQGVVCNLK